MNQDDKRQLENELTVMGLPGLDTPELVQTMADIVNGYPVPAERVDFFCDLLNECEGARRREMYEAMRPRLSFNVPSLDACEARIAAKAERMIRPRLMPGELKDGGPLEYALDLECGGCGKTEAYIGQTKADAMGEARKAGWGRGPRWGCVGSTDREGREHCAECRLMAMAVKAFGESFAGRHADSRLN